MLQTPPLPPCSLPSAGRRHIRHSYASRHTAIRGGEDASASPPLGRTATAMLPFASPTCRGQQAPSEARTRHDCNADSATHQAHVLVRGDGQGADRRFHARERMQHAQAVQAAQLQHHSLRPREQEVAVRSQRPGVHSLRGVGGAAHLAVDGEELQRQVCRRVEDDGAVTGHQHLAERRRGIAVSGGHRSRG